MKLRKYKGKKGNNQRTEEINNKERIDTKKNRTFGREKK